MHIDLCKHRHIVNGSWTIIKTPFKNCVLFFMIVCIIIIFCSFPSVKNHLNGEKELHQFTNLSENKTFFSLNLKSISLFLLLLKCYPIIRFLFSIWNGECWSWHLVQYIALLLSHSVLILIDYPKRLFVRSKHVRTYCNQPSAWSTHDHWSIICLKCNFVHADRSFAPIQTSPIWRVVVNWKTNKHPIKLIVTKSRNVSYEIHCLRVKPANNRLINKRNHFAMYQTLRFTNGINIKSVQNNKKQKQKYERKLKLNQPTHKCRKQTLSLNCLSPHYYSLCLNRNLHTEKQ